MAITVYWTCLEDEWMKASKPEPVNKRFYSRNVGDKSFDSGAAINFCPVFNTNLINLYAVKSIYEYSFRIENNTCVSNYYTQKFYEDHVVIRSIEQKFFSFNVGYAFFTEEDSLELGLYQYPLFEENEITKRCILLPGVIDIGKYFRKTEFPFFLKKDFDEFVVNDEDVLYYLKFNTKEKIIFKQFKMNENIHQIANSARLSNNGTGKLVKNMDYFYNKFKGKKYLLNEIKNNLIE